MNKKGQFYIIIVLVICMALYGVTRDENTIKEATLFEDFSQLSANYVEEAPKIINYAVYDHKDVNDTLENFTKEFLSYAKKKDPNMGLLYVYGDGTPQIKINNYMDEEVATPGEKTIPGFNQEIVQSITVNIGGKDFYHQVPVGVDEFGEEWYSSSQPNPGLLKLSVGGILHTFDLTATNIPLFKVLIKSENVPETELDIAGDADEEFDPQFSPSDDDFFENVVEVKTNE